MARGNLLNLADFRGTSRSWTNLNVRRSYPECLACGSSLAGRLESIRNGGTTETEIYRCRCGRGRHVSREVAAA